jgi:hypothetical protein
VTVVTTTARRYGPTVAEVTDIDIDRQRSVRLTFDDGFGCELPLDRPPPRLPVRDLPLVPGPRRAGVAPPGQPATVTDRGCRARRRVGPVDPLERRTLDRIYSWDALRSWCERSGDPAFDEGDDGSPDGLVPDLPEAFEG